MESEEYMGEGRTASDEVQLRKVNKGQRTALKTDFKEKERKANRLWTDKGENKWLKGEGLQVE